MTIEERIKAAIDGFCRKANRGIKCSYGYTIRGERRFYQMCWKCDRHKALAKEIAEIKEVQ